MPKEHPIELFMPPNMLKAKVGSSIGGIDMAAVRRAEAAVEVLKVDFAEWIGDDVDRLIKARERFARDKDQGARDALDGRYCRGFHFLAHALPTYTRARVEL